MNGTMRRIKSNMDQVHLHRRIRRITRQCHHTTVTILTIINLKTRTITIITVGTRMTLVMPSHLARLSPATMTTIDLKRHHRDRRRPTAISSQTTPKMDSVMAHIRVLSDLSNTFKTEHPMNARSTIPSLPRIRNSHIYATSNDSF